MGRSGGGRSGGGRSGGFSGGSRSSGGFSGGRRSGGRSFGGGFGAGSGPGAGRRPPRPGGPGFWAPRPRVVYRGGSGIWPFLAGMGIGRSAARRDGGGPAEPGPGSGGGCAPGGCFGALMLVIALLVVFSLLNGLSSCSLASCSAALGTDVAASTVAREPLPAGSVTETGYYTDEDGDWIHQPATLERGLRTFYEKTGVQPYVYILPNGSVTSTTELTSRAEALYDELFDDEAHFLLVFCDDGAGSYHCGYTAGSLARSVMDDEAVGILADYLERDYSNLDLSEEEIFSDAFAETADRIMAVTTPPIVYIAICAAVVVVAIVVAVILKRRRDERAREREHLEDVLNTPLETFGDEKLDDLEEKYRSSADSK